MSDLPPDSVPTPHETPMQFAAVSALEELNAIAVTLEPRWQRALLEQARRIQKAQGQEIDRL